ncbi:hypothetical protein LCGC14_2038470 [marine sediment metagenome]|uniref:DUF362 domain-containing protein n=1 Tax=marine sediment metagenome TaxID=412755 RepID=A0A0F9FF73_9ZZZZ
MNNNNKIAISEINNGDVKSAVFEALNSIDAGNLFKRHGMKILIKPNLLAPKKPEKAVTTHPAVLRAVIHWLKQFNPKRIIVADSSGTYLKGITDLAFEVSGIRNVCEEEHIEFIPFERTKCKSYKVESPLILNEFPASRLLEECDIIINIPKIKTHINTKLTCSIKNMFGTLILELKSKTHKMFPNNLDFNCAIVDIYSVSQPQLTIIDGFYCQEGNGPSMGDVVKLDLILAGFDPVALDTTVCKIIDFNPEDIQHIYMVVVRYESGDSFGRSYGNWKIVGVYKNVEDAQEILDKINYDEKHRYDEDYKKEYEKEFRDWDGYFERFENVDIEVLHVL